MPPPFKGGKGGSRRPFHPDSDSTLQFTWACGGCCVVVRLCIGFGFHFRFRFSFPFFVVFFVFVFVFVPVLPPVGWIGGILGFCQNAKPFLLSSCGLASAYVVRRWLYYMLRHGHEFGFQAKLQQWRSTTRPPFSSSCANIPSSSSTPSFLHIHLHLPCLLSWQYLLLLP